MGSTLSPLAKAMNYTRRIPSGPATDATFFEAALGTLPHAVVVCHADDLRIVYANRQATSELNLQRPEMDGESEEVVGESIDALLSGAIAESRALLALHEMTRQSVRLIGRTLDISVKRMPAEPGGAEQLIVSWSATPDHGSTSWAEEFAISADESSSSIAQFTIDKAAEAVYWIREDGSLAYFNEAACDLLGYSSTEMAELTVMDLDPNCEPEDWAAAWPNMIAGAMRIYKWTQQRKDGSVVPVEISSNFLVLDGRGYNVSFVRDISDQRRADDELRDRTTRVRQAQRIARLGSFVRNMQTGEVEIEGVEEIFLVPRETLAGRDAFLDMVHRDDRATLKSTMLNAINNKEQSYRARYRITTTPGDQAIIEELGEFTYGDDGEPVLLSGTIQDITERRQAEEQLEFTQFALDSAAEAVFFLKRDATVAYVNDAACDMLGYSRDELLKMTVCDFNPSLLPEMIEERWQEVRHQHDEAGGGFVFETINQQKDGTIIDVEVAGRFIEYGSETYHLTFSRDITDRKRAQEALRENEAQLRLVADNLPALIAYADNEQRYRFANRTCAQWYGRPAEAILGQTVAELQQDEYERFRPHIERVLTGERLSFETTGAYPDGETRTVRCTYVPHRGASGEVEGISP